MINNWEFIIGCDSSCLACIRNCFLTQTFQFANWQVSPVSRHPQGLHWKSKFFSEWRQNIRYWQTYTFYWQNMHYFSMREKKKVTISAHIFNSLFNFLSILRQRQHTRECSISFNEKLLLSTSIYSYFYFLIQIESFNKY